MFPATKVVKKCFLPVVTADGVAKPIIQIIIEEALSAGIEAVGLVINPEDEGLFKSFFAPVTPAMLKSLPKHLQSEAQKLSEIGEKVSYIHQKEQKGLGHAVLCAQNWVAKEPFMLLLGDHIYKSHQKASCSKQIVDCFEALGAKTSVIGIYHESLENVEHYGTVTGEWEDEKILSVSNIKEKPTSDIAAEYLGIKYHGREQFFCVNGIYILDSLIFTILQEQNDSCRLNNGELELTTALRKLGKVMGFYGYHVDGKHFDTGLPKKFAGTVYKNGNLK
jgi:UTP--glucose-1-phosphate uridylyltransferase